MLFILFKSDRLQECRLVKKRMSERERERERERNWQYPMKCRINEYKTFKLVTIAFLAFSPIPSVLQSFLKWLSLRVIKTA